MLVINGPEGSSKRWMSAENHYHRWVHRRWLRWRRLGSDGVINPVDIRAADSLLT